MKNNILSTFYRYNLMESVGRDIGNTSKSDIKSKGEILPLCNYTYEGNTFLISLVSNSPDKMVIDVDGHKIEIDKRDKGFDGDSREIYIDNLTYCNPDIALSDGGGTWNGFDYIDIEMNFTHPDYDSICDRLYEEHKNDEFEINWPSVKEIFSNPELIDIAFSYDSDLQEKSVFELLKEYEKIDLNFLFEGFYFSVDWCIIKK